MGLCSAVTRTGDHETVIHFPKAMTCGFAKEYALLARPHMSRSAAAIRMRDPEMRTMAEIQHQRICLTRVDVTELSELNPKWDGRRDEPSILLSFFVTTPALRLK